MTKPRSTRPFTPDELATVTAMHAAGKSQAETRRAIRIAPDSFSRNVQALGLVFAPPVFTPGTPPRQFTPEELDLVTAMAAGGKGKRETHRMVKCGWSQFDRLVKEHGIRFASDLPKPPKPDRTHLRGAASKPKRARNPMKDINTWRPPVAVTTLEQAVQTLRTRYSPVCAEDTIRYPRQAPEPYRATTLFRCGARENVTAAELVEMAAA